MFGSSQKSVGQKPWCQLSVYVYVYKCMFVWICLHDSRGRCAKNSDHLFISTTILRSHLRIFTTMWPLNNDHLSSTSTILGSQRCSLYTGLTVLYCIILSSGNMFCEKNVSTLNTMRKKLKRLLPILFSRKL